MTYVKNCLVYVTASFFLSRSSCTQPSFMPYSKVANYVGSIVTTVLKLLLNFSRCPQLAACLSKTTARRYRLLWKHCFGEQAVKMNPLFLMINYTISPTQVVSDSCLVCLVDCLFGALEHRLDVDKLEEIRLLNR